MTARMALVTGGATSALRLENVAKTYRDSWGRRFTPLRDVTLDVQRGEVFGLLGPNGAGKSTTFKIVLGLIRASSGKGSLLGHPLGSLDALRRIGFLPENPYFYDYLTAQEFLETCAALNGVPASGRRARIAAILEAVGLDPAERRRLRKFSKGMLQRVGFAQAVLHDPELVVLDEPMSGLDPVGRRQMRDLILRLKEEGKTIIFASHVLPDVEALCDRVGILIDGVLRRTGRVEDLVPEAGALEIEASGLPESMVETWTREGSARRAGDRVLVHAGDHAEVERVARTIFGSGGVLHAVRPLRGSLEEVFLSELAGSAAAGRHGGQNGPRRGAA